MCTAVFCGPDHPYLGRTLDYEHSFGEELVITPRNFPLAFRHLPVMRQHYAICGMASVRQNYPLYFDGFNEKGLAAAGLNFTQSTVYGHPGDAEESLTQFELLPRLLGSCATVEEAVRLLHRCVITGESFSPDLPAARLHWIVADAAQCVAVEAVAEGLRIYPNPTGVLTNEPPFPLQLWHLSRYPVLSPQEPESHSFAPVFFPSRGAGGLGLPGDLTSPSRFVRAAFGRANARWEKEADSQIVQMFHLMASVAQLKGCCRTAPEDYECTRYTGVMDPAKGIYCYTTYENPRPTALSLEGLDLNADALLQFPLRRSPDILREG